MDKTSTLNIAVMSTGQSFYDVTTSGYLRCTLLNLVLGRFMFSDAKIDDAGSLLACPPSTKNFIQWHFQLKTDLEFHDGKKLTSFDIKKSFEFLFSSPYETPDLSVLRPYFEPTGIECHGPLEISFTLKKPCTVFDKIIYESSLSPVPVEHLLSPVEHLKAPSSNCGAHLSWKKIPIGCGPFAIVESYEEGRSILLKRVKPSTDKFNFIKLISTNVLTDADLILGADENPDAQKFSEVKLPIPFLMYGLYFDYSHPLARNVEFRKYLMESIDRTTLHKVVPTALSNPLPVPVKWMSKEFLKKLIDPSPAKNQSFWKPGNEKIKIRVGKSSDATRRLITNELKRQWEEKGLIIEFSDGQVVGGFTSLIPSVPGPLQVFQLFQRGSSWTGDLSEQHDHYQFLMNKADSASSPKEQESIFEELSQEFVNQVLAIPLFEFPLIIYANSKKMDLSTIGAVGTEILAENIKNKITNQTRKMEQQPK